MFGDKFENAFQPVVARQCEAPGEVSAFVPPPQLIVFRVRFKKFSAFRQFPARALYIMYQTGQIFATLKMLFPLTNAIA